MKVAPEVEEALWTAAARRLPGDVLRPGRLAAAVLDRTRRYTSERQRLGEPLAGEAAAADLAARALFFTATDAAKIALPLAELAARELMPARRPLRVLDLGAGAGAMTLGLAAFLHRTGGPVDLEVVAVERDAAALALMAEAAGELARALGGTIALESRAADVLRHAPAAGAFDLVLAGGILNELDEAARAPLVDRGLAALAPGGALIAIEPALRETSRALHRLRDQILARGAAHVFAPCTRGGMSCPALASERDWCHEDRPLALAPRTAALAAATGLRDTGIKFSYLVLRREPDPILAPRPGRAALRVVSEPRKAKGRRELTACGDAGWVALRLLTRHRSDATRPFERARRGDLLVVREPATDGDITPADEVERVAAADP
jgi:ribosomal protein RSM22 (predicted rRNA methylase)